MSEETIIVKPPKKKPKTIRQQCAEDMAVFQEKITETFTCKFDRLEQALLAMAATSNRDTTDPGAATHSDPLVNQPFRGDQGTDHTRTGPPHTGITSPPVNFGPALNISSAAIAQASGTPLVQGVTSGQRNEVTSHAPHPRNEDTRRQNEVATLTQNDNNNNTDTSPAWFIAKALETQPPLTSSQPLSTADCQYDDDMEAKVNHILASTAHQLSASGKPSFFPHKFVSRGPDRRRPAFNMLSMSEHVWGIFMIMWDKRLSADLKPIMYKHVQDII